MSEMRLSAEEIEILMLESAKCSAQQHVQRCRRRLQEAYRELDHAQEEAIELDTQLSRARSRFYVRAMA